MFRSGRHAARRRWALPIVLVLAIGASVVATAPAAGAGTSARGGATVSPAAFQGQSPRLSQLPATVSRGLAHAEAHPARTLSGASSPAPNNAAPRGDVQTVAGTASAMTAGTSFEAVSHDSIDPLEPCGTPPDPNSDVSDSYIVEIVNCGYAAYDKSGTLLLGPLTTDKIFSGMSGPCSQTDDGDGVVRYDRLAHRWLVSQFSLANDDGLIDPSTGAVYTQNFQCVAISKTSDPTGAYWLYAFGYDGFNDYPKFGVWPDAYYVTYNMFTAGEGSYTGVKTCALDRAAMLTGAAATQQCFDKPSPVFSVLPANVTGTTAPPAGTPNYQLSLDRYNTSILDAWAFHVDWTTPANSTYTQLPSIPIASYAQACAGYTRNQCVPQAPGQYFTTATLESLGDRLMDPLQYRNFGDHQSLVVSHSVRAASGSGADERWYELRVQPDASLSLFQQGTYSPGDGLYRFMGSIAQDGAGDMALGYSVSSASIHPGIRLTGRQAADPAGTMTEAEHHIKDGTGSEGNDPGAVSPVVGRWGDYTSMQVDPADDCTFWYTNEYYNAQTDGSDRYFYRRWHTVISSFAFPSCSSDFSVAAVPSSRTTRDTTTTTVRTALTRGSTQNVAFSVSGCPSGATCTFDSTSAAVGSDVTLTVQPGTAEDGTYHLTITGTGSVAGVHAADFTLVLDRTEPSAVLTAPSAPFVVATSAHLAWQGSDTGGTGIAHYEIQRTLAPYNGRFGAWSSYATKPAATSSMTATRLTEGDTYCFRVRAVDRAGNVGKWSARRCTAVPLDDRSLSASSGWTRATGKSYWNATITKTSRVHSALTRTGARLQRLAVVATRCSGCGVVGVYVGRALIGKINLAGATQYRRLYALPAFGSRTGIVKIKVLSSGKQVQIDGLGISGA